jgi:hypothetical protein
MGVRRIELQGYSDALISYHDPSPPAPGAAPTIAGTPSGTDVTLMETRGYVYTYVNSYGAEGPPSLVSNLLDIYDGNSVTVSGMSTAPAAIYDVLYKRIYRLNQTSGGFAQYQFVAEIPVATTSYVDTILDSSLSEVLQSTEWDGPPAGITGLIALPNGVLAGFVRNTLCYSVPFYPHAWPAAYQKVFDRDIVALGAFGTTVVVLTEGTPYVNVGNDPANTVTERVHGFSCMSKKGKVQAGEVVVYPSPEGLMAIGPSGPELITWEVITPDQWFATYNPSSINAYYWQGKYIGFYTRGTGVDYVEAGFIFDLKTKDLINLDFYARAGFYDKVDGTLYLVVDGDIVAFNEESRDFLELNVPPSTPFAAGEIIVGATSHATATVIEMVVTNFYAVESCTGTFIPGEVVGVGANTADQTGIYPIFTSKNRTLLYKTKRQRFPLGTFGAIKVLSDTYPVDIDVIFPKIPLALHVDIPDSEPVRLKTYLVDEVEVLVHGLGVSIVYLASTLGEFPS